MDVERDLEDTLDTVLNIHPGTGDYVLRASQLREELKWLSETVGEADPETVMEIGTLNGGTLYTWCRHFDSLGNAISLDLPGSKYEQSYVKRQLRLFRTFSRGAEMNFVRQDSHEQKTLEQVRRRCLSDGETVDFLFIDGDHTYEGVKQDFEMYKQLTSDDAIVAFHDIVPHPEKEEVEKRRRRSDGDEKYFQWNEAHEYCQVDKFWRELTAEYDTESIIGHEDQTWGGIGVVFLG